MTKYAKHPATYTASIIACMEDCLLEHVGKSYTTRPPRVIDPMAGTGKIFNMIPWCTWRGVDLEVWDEQDNRVELGDATCLDYPDDFFDAAIVSPTYGNGFADHHIPKDSSVRTSYFHRLRGAGHVMHPNNSGWFHFGPRGSKRETGKYKILHMKAWREVYRVLRVDGVFLLNVKNFYAANEYQDVTAWHKEMCERIGFELVDTRMVPVPGLKYGDEKTLKRDDHEYVMVFRKP